jgi:hypothetical protein
MAGRPMREYFVLPPAIMGDQSVLRDWVDRALRFVTTKLPKEAKSAKSKASSKMMRAG